MDLAELLQILIRRWFVVVAAVVVAFAAGWITAPGTDEAPQYQATHTLIVNPNSPAAGSATRPNINLDQAALLATTGAVPAVVAEQLGLDVDTLVDHVEAEADAEVLALDIHGYDEDSATAEAIADATAEALVAQLSAGGDQTYDRQIQSLTERSNELRVMIGSLQATVTAEPGNATAEAELLSAQNEYSIVLQQLRELTLAGPPAPPLITVANAQAQVARPDGIRAPDSPLARGLLLAAFGVAIGAAAAVALDRLDTRLHTKRAAEAAFGFPVVAEIPSLPRSGGKDLTVTASPSSPFAEAYRGLRSVVALAGPEHGMRTNGSNQHRVILVTSPLAAEGKTTTVAHLAAMLGEVGRTTLVVSGDFRRPRLHEYFRREREPGLTEVLSGGPGAPTLADLDLTTPIRNVRFIPSGAPVENPAPLVEQAGDMLRAGRDLCDFVLVDSPPVLVANDAVEFAAHADGVLVIARAGQTTTEAAERTAEMLRRVNAPVLGVVLVEANDMPLAYRYYRYRYYTSPEVMSRRQRRRQQRTEGGDSGPDVPAERHAGARG